MVQQLAQLPGESILSDAYIESLFYEQESRESNIGFIIEDFFTTSDDSSDDESYNTTTEDEISDAY